MTAKIAGNDIQWNEYLIRLSSDKQDIYYTREYYLMEQEEEGKEAVLFVYEDEKQNIALYPFLKRKINSPILKYNYYDIETAYGYGGALVNTTNENFIIQFESAFLRYCKEENIIAEFIRFHPLLRNESIFKHNIEILHNRYTVWLDLTSEIDDIWMHQVSTQNRNTIRKCKKNGLVVQISDDYEEFYDIYIQTMKKVQADSFYLFDFEYFMKLKKNKNIILFRVRKENETIAAAIFMKYGVYFHYHLAGSKKEALKWAPNNILLWEAIKYAKTQGCKIFHFGGGLTDSKEDNLFRFKSKFSKDTADFFIGKRVHNKEVYNKLIQYWEEEHGEKASLFLQYAK